MVNNKHIYQELKNELENVKNNETLQQYLSQATIMVVSVTASTTQGKNLTKEELDICKTILEKGQLQVGEKERGVAQDRRFM